MQLHCGDSWYSGNIARGQSMDEAWRDEGGALPLALVRPSIDFRSLSLSHAVVRCTDCECCRVWRVCVLMLRFLVRFGGGPAPPPLV